MSACYIIIIVANVYMYMYMNLFVHELMVYASVYECVCVCVRVSIYSQNCRPVLIISVQSTSGPLHVRTFVVTYCKATKG